MTISLIWAQDLNGGIGYQNKIPWYIPEDFKHFKELTSGNTIIMGSLTWDSLPKKPLPNRQNIILTKDKNKLKPEYKTQFTNSENITFTTFDNLDISQMQSSSDKFFIIGGSQIYQLFISFANELVVTKVLEKYKVDVYAPQIDLNVFKLVNTEPKDGWEIETYHKLT